VFKRGLVINGRSIMSRDVTGM